MLVQYIQLHSFKKQLAIDLFCLSSDKNLRRDYHCHYKNHLFAPISEWIPLNPNQRCIFISTRFDISEKQQEQKRITLDSPATTDNKDNDDQPAIDRQMYSRPCFETLLFYKNKKHVQKW